MTTGTTTLEGGANTTGATGQQPAGTTTAVVDTAAADKAAADTAAATAAAAKATADKVKADAAAADKAAADAKAAAGAPEKYESFKLPEGVVIAPEMLTGLEGLARKLNLPQDKAQELADFAAAETKAANDTQVAYIKQMGDEWLSKSKADPEFGGAKYDATAANNARFIDAFGDAELKTLLNETGFGNHPALMRLIHRAQKVMGEDAYVKAGTGETGPSTTLAGHMYPSAAKA